MRPFRPKEVETQNVFLQIFTNSNYNDYYRNKKSDFCRQNRSKRTVSRSNPLLKITDLL